VNNTIKQNARTESNNNKSNNNNAQHDSVKKQTIRVIHLFFKQFSSLIKSVFCDVQKKFPFFSLSLRFIFLFVGSSQKSNVSLISFCVWLIPRVMKWICRLNCPVKGWIVSYFVLKLQQLVHFDKKGLSVCLRLLHLPQTNQKLLFTFLSGFLLKNVFSKFGLIITYSHFLRNSKMTNTFLFVWNDEHSNNSAIPLDCQTFNLLKKLSQIKFQDLFNKQSKTFQVDFQR
jgi:hypothetical protein